MNHEFIAVTHFSLIDYESIYCLTPSDIVHKDFYNEKHIAHGHSAQYYRYYLSLVRPETKFFL